MRFLARFAVYHLMPRGRWVGDVIAAWTLVAVALVLWAIVPGALGTVLAALVGLAAAGSFVNAIRP